MRPYNEAIYSLLEIISNLLIILTHIWFFVVYIFSQKKLMLYYFEFISIILFLSCIGNEIIFGIILILKFIILIIQKQIQNKSLTSQFDLDKQTKEKENKNNKFHIESISKNEIKKLIISRKGNLATESAKSGKFNILDKLKKGIEKKIKVKLGNFLRPGISYHSFNRLRNSSHVKIPITIIPFKNDTVVSSLKNENSIIQNPQDLLSNDIHTEIPNKKQN